MAAARPRRRRSRAARSGFALRKPSRRLAQRRFFGAVFAVASLLTPFFLGAAVGGVASGRAAPGTPATAHVWASTTSVVAGLLAVAATAFLGAVFLTADAHRFDAPDMVVYFRRRAWCSLAVVAVLALIGLAETRDHTSYVYDRLTHGLGLLLVVLAAVAAAATAWLVAGRAAGWARFTSVAAVALVIAALGAAQRPYLVPTSLTVQQAAGAAGVVALAADRHRRRGRPGGARPRGALPPGHPRPAGGPDRRGRRGRRPAVRRELRPAATRPQGNDRRSSRPARRLP